MKKNFENPVMNVSLFNVENIVTESAVTTNEQVAKDNVAGVTNLTEANFADLKFIY